MKSSGRKRLRFRTTWATIVLAMMWLGPASASTTGLTSDERGLGWDRHESTTSIGELCMKKLKIKVTPPPSEKPAEPDGSGKTAPSADAPNPTAAPAEASSATEETDEHEKKRELRLQKRREELKKRTEEAAKRQQDAAGTTPAASDAPKGAPSMDGKAIEGAKDQTPLDSTQAQAPAASPADELQKMPPKRPDRHRFKWQARP